MIRMTACRIALCVLGLLPALAMGSVVQSNLVDLTSQTAFTCSATDLINGGQPSMASNTPTAVQSYGGYPAALTNGSIGAPSTLLYDGVVNEGAWTATFYLNTSVNTNGYTITNLSSFAAWATGRISQGYELKLAFHNDPSPGTFYSYGNYSLVPSPNNPANGSSKLQLTDTSGIIAENVSAIRYMFVGNGAVYREIDAFGYPSTTTAQGPPVVYVYVATNGSHQPPYNSWATAATNLPSANVVAGNARILVSNGTYGVSSEIALTDGTSIRSMNGWSNTIIRRTAGTTRIFNITAGATIDGFTIRDANNCAILMTAGTVKNCLFTGNSGTYGAIDMGGGTVSNCVFTGNSATSADGGGIHMKSPGGLVVNCIITNNSANRWGGGVEFETTLSGATIRNCLIARNTAGQGAGGVSCYNAIANIENCTIVSNRVTGAYSGGGIWEQVGGSLSLTNTIVWSNSAPTSPNIAVGGGSIRAANSCSTEWGVLGGNGINNIALEPMFKDFANGNYRLHSSSPCVDAGTNIASVAIDLDGIARPFDGDYNGVAIHDIGAYEMNEPAAYSCDFSAPVTVGTDTLQVVFTAVVRGSETETNILWYGWDFTNTGNYAQSGPGLIVVTNLYSEPGVYAVRLAVSNDQGIVTSRVRTAFVRIYSSAGMAYVSTNGAQQWPYDTWAKASQSIQPAIDVAPNLTVLVSNGTYDISSEILPNNGTVIQSVNGASNTIIRRTNSTLRLINISTYAGTAVTNCTIDGFTIRDGNAPTLGGGMNMVTGSTVRNCLIINNAGGLYGAIHMAGGTVSNCVFAHNTAAYDGGGIHAAGGASVIANCIFTNNTAGRWGGGIEFENSSAGSVLRNCLVARNTSTKQGGGVSCFASSVLRIENCTIVSNTSVDSDGSYPPAGGGGVYFNSSSVGLTNTIICSNKASSASDYSGTPIAGYSCSPAWDVANAGLRGNITYDPQFINFANANYRLSALSACVDAGTNLASVPIDLDGNPRPYDGDYNGSSRHDMGAYEMTDPSVYSCDFAAAPAIGTNSLQVVFTASIIGSALETNILWYGWDFTNGGAYGQAGPGLQVVTNFYSEPGLYSVRLAVSNDQGGVTSRVRTACVRIYSDSGVVYVSTNGGQLWPYDTWAKASQSIQPAIDVASNLLVRVSNGTYALTSEIIPQNGTVLRSENGASNTVLRRALGTIRIFNIGLYVGSPIGNTVIDGFTIRDGAGNGSLTAGAIDMTVGTIQNCNFISNSSVYGAINITGSGIISNCAFTRNSASADGGGVHIASGAKGVIVNCSFISNSVTRWGGAIECENSIAGTLIRNCLIARNSAGDSAGGISTYFFSANARALIENCTIVSNSAVNVGGGVWRSQSGGNPAMTNCIVYFNRAPSGTNLFGTIITGYSCSPDLTDGLNGNRTADPLLKSLADGDYRLLPSSPCFDSGINQTWMTNAFDLDGIARIKRGTVDMGAYEIPGIQGTFFRLY